jgi:hypothetical protein
VTALIVKDPVRRRLGIRKHLEGDLELVPIATDGGACHVELRGRVKTEQPPGRPGGSWLMSYADALLDSLGPTYALELRAGTAAVRKISSLVLASAPARQLQAQVRRPARWLPSRLVSHRHRPGAELQPAHELQVDRLR